MLQLLKKWANSYACYSFKLFKMLGKVCLFASCSSSTYLSSLLHAYRGSKPVYHLEQTFRIFFN
jgi:hypothetical protein